MTPVIAAHIRKSNAYDIEAFTAASRPMRFFFTRRGDKSTALTIRE